MFSAIDQLQRDSLTGVYSRSALRFQLNEEIENARQQDCPLTLIMLDIDYFKSINDAFGHTRGDEILVSFAHLLQSHTRPSDLVFRYGGDEFVILLPHTEKSQAVEVAQHLLTETKSVRLATYPHTSISLSLGVASFPLDGQTPETLFEIADQRHYHAKQMGRARVVAESPLAGADRLVQEPSRLIERDQPLEVLNRFLEALPGQERGILRVNGGPSSGKVRFLAEARKIARLRGYILLALQGKPALKTRHYSVLTEGLRDSASLALPESSIPTSFKTGEAAFRTALWEWVQEKGNVGLLVTLNDVHFVDSATLRFIHDLFYATDFPCLGLVYTERRSSARAGLPWDFPLQEEVTLQPLSLNGLQVWVRQALLWEAPPEFIQWLYQETGGQPGLIQRGLTYLVREKLLRPLPDGWMITTTYASVSLNEVLSQQISVEISHLPTNLTDFIGRDVEIQKVKQLLRDHRLVTLLGPGGIGKTRLAIQVAAENADRFADGVHFVPLTSLQSGELIYSTLADILQLSTVEPREPKELLYAYLRERELIFVLDNYEHLLDWTELLSELLANAPGLRLLVTSRERLNLPGEVIFEVQGLPVPHEDQAVDIENYGAVQMFLHIAYRVQPDFMLSEAQKPFVARICRMVGGMPLGIEMAASWMQLYSPRDIAEHIIQSIASLKLNDPEFGEPYRRLRTIYDSFWITLSPSEQAVLTRLSIFQDGFSVDAAIQVAGASVFFLGALASRSFLRRSPQARYFVHELLRQFTFEKLEADPVACTQAIENYCRFYISLLEAQNGFLAVDRDTLELFRADLENIRNAWQLAMSHDWMALIGRGAPHIVRFFRQAGLLREGEMIIEQSVNRARGIAARSSKRSGLENQAVLGKLLAGQAGLLNDRGKFAQAVKVAQEAINLSVQFGDHLTEALTRLELGYSYFKLWNMEQAEIEFNRVLDQAQAVQLPQVDAESLRQLGNVCFYRGNYSGALLYYERSLQRSQEIGYQKGIAATLSRLAAWYSRIGDNEKAIHDYNAAQQIYIEIGERRGEGIVLNNLGWVYQGQADYIRAKIHLEQSLRINQESGDRWMESVTLNNLGITCHRLGDLDGARRYYTRHVEICQEINEKGGQIAGLSNLELLHYHLGEFDTARGYYDQSMGLAFDYAEGRLTRTYPQTRLGYLLLAQGAYPAAEKAFREALEVRREFKRPDITLDPLAGLAAVALKQDNPAQALEYANQILEMFERVNLDDQTDDPYWIYLVLYQVLQANGDDRAEDILHQACERLRLRTERIQDEQVRLLYLESIPSRKEVRRLCELSSCPISL